ncbi:hypothetical protein TRP8649_01405 [Pelagimonas phthalicica]|uniref:Phage-related minor tail protein n=1 Tax=Pelagimonas phthalicica TaxID=1037362 RepID=A0A238JBG9_9RHOB|nr:phage tail tape measure protein [Pelagimonas phthalicica]TDS94173.1 hypothetical protein CLV87_0667 [Pelagimonas phthalicica]SMX27302.1 hypothetical protein TRP8649_01405 [Pelagimonas phthalicica]
MSSKNQRLNATITVGAALEGSVKRNIGFLKSGLEQVGDSIKKVERRQKELDRQRAVLKKQGKSVEELDREYQDLERTLNDLRRAQERWNRAAKASRRVGATFNSMASDIGRNARRIAVGAGLAGGAIFGVASSTAELGDNVAKTADKLGIGIETLQELRYAAERSGVATATFDGALEKMTKNIGLALEGTGAQKDALDALGLSAENLAAMSPEAALAAIADSLQGIDSNAEKAALASDLLGRSGISMLNMLRGGSEGLEQLREDARRTGYVLTEQAARDAEVFQDTLLDTELALKGLKNTVGAALMPVVTKAMKRVGDALIDNREGIIKWSEDFASGVERVLPLVGEVFAGISRVSSIVWGVVEGTAEMVGGWENFGVVIGAVLAARTVTRVVKFGAAVFSFGKALIGLQGVLPLVAGGLRAIGVAMMMNPIGLAVAGIAAAGAVIYANWDKLAPWFKGMWGDVKKTFNGFSNFVGGVFTGDMDRAAHGLETMWTGLEGAFDRTLATIGDAFAWNYENVIKPVTDKLGLTEPIENQWKMFKTAHGAVLSGVGDNFQSTWTAKIKPVIAGLVDTESIRLAWDGLKANLNPTISGIGISFDATWTAFIKPVIDGLKATGGIAGAWEAAKAALDPVLTWIGQKFDSVMAFIKPVIEALTWTMDNAKKAGSAISEAVGMGRKSSVLDSNPGGNKKPGQPSGMDRLRGNIPPSMQPGSAVTKRALGGPFNPGWTLTGELGPELKFENRAGYVADNRAMRQLADYAGKVGSVIGGRSKRLTAPSGLSERVNALFSKAATMAQSAAAQAVTQHVTKNYTIHAANADAYEVVRLLKQEDKRDHHNGLFDRVPATGLHGR